VELLKRPPDDPFTIPLKRGAWKKLVGRTIRIPLDEDQDMLGLVLFAEYLGLLLYIFGPFSESEIIALHGQLPNATSALMLADVSGLALRDGKWTVDPTFPLSSLPAEVPVVIKNPVNWGFTAARLQEVQASDIVVRPGTFAALAKEGGLVVHGSEALETTLHWITTPVGEYVPMAEDISNKYDTLEQAAVRHKGRKVALTRGDVFKANLPSGEEAYAWVLNTTGIRVDCCFFATNPVSVVDRIRGPLLPVYSLTRLIFFPGEWFEAVTKVGPVGHIAPSILETFAQPVFRHTDQEFPSGRYDFALELDHSDLWTVSQIKRISLAEAQRLFVRRLFTEFGIVDALETRLKQQMESYE